MRQPGTAIDLGRVAEIHLPFGPGTCCVSERSAYFLQIAYVS
jgi:hypothetical protein